MVSRPDISFATGVLSRHSSAPGKMHMEAAKDLVKYLYNTKHLQIVYSRTDTGGNVPVIFEKGSPPESDEGESNSGGATIDDLSNDIDESNQFTVEDRLVDTEPSPLGNEPSTYVDADHGGCKNTRRSTSGFICMLNGGPISWSSKIQKLAAQSSAESEIYAATDSVKEASHIRLLCEEVGARKPGIPMMLLEDNQACIRLAHNLRGSKAAKQYQLRLRFLHVHDRVRLLEFRNVHTSKQLADAFTKPLSGPTFLKARSLMLRGTRPD